jgi:hypothetical protein
MRSYADLCRAMQSYAELCRAMRSYAELCGAMRSYAGLCGVKRQGLGGAFALNLSFFAENLIQLCTALALASDHPQRWQTHFRKPTFMQGYIVRFGQCSVFLIPINKRRRWKLVLSLTDGALYCS